MNGLEKKMARLFSNKGVLFLGAFDHPQIYGTMEGLENTPELVHSLRITNLDGYILNPGMIRQCEAKDFARKTLVVRASVGGTMLGKVYSDLHECICSAKQAAQLGADAALVMFVLGGSHDKESQLELARVCEEYHEYGIPVIAEVLHDDYTKNNDTDFIASGARIAAEMGADIIKAFYCKDFEKVTSNCPVPVVLAGGPKDQDICAVVKEVIRKGAKGLAFGRNIFQCESPRKMIEKIDSALR